MDILVTGRLASISSSFYDKLTQQYKVVAASDDIDTAIIGRKCTPYQISTQDEQFRKLFTSYTFSKVIYFTARPEENNGYYLELQDLENTLRLCSEFDVQQILCISSTYLYEGIPNADENTIPSPNSIDSISLYACEQLCDFYREKRGMSIVVLHVPCLYGHFESRSVVGNMLRQITIQNHVLFQAKPEQIIDLLAQEDLGELVLRMLYEPNEKLSVINVPGACQLTFAQLGELLERLVHSTRISYSGMPTQIYPPIQSKIARKEFDFLPTILVENEIQTLIWDIDQKSAEKKQGLKQKIAELLKGKSFIIQSIELIIGYLLMEYFNTLTNTAIHFTAVDFRLLFVVLLGISHGLKLGVAAASLAALSCLISHMIAGTDWRVLLYNIDNWLPFVSYFLIGSVTGYIKDKYTNDLEFVKDEKDELEKRYIFLNELYSGTLQNKGQFKKQIMSYRDSYGRIFEITKRLNTMMPDLIFKEALSALEDVLDNQTVSIYSINPSNSYGRLTVCSKKIFHSLPKSMDFEKFPILKETMDRREVWSNTNLTDGYPDYAFPVYRGKKPVLTIMIWNASFEQMAMYFENLFKILCSLIEASLLRAFEYEEKFSDEMYLPETRVMKKEAFKEVLRIREQMEEASISEYSLICINTTVDSIVQIASEVEKFLRDSDVLGEGDDGKLYIILTQTDKNKVPVVLERFKTAGLF